MKRFFLLMALVVLCVGMASKASAQETTVVVNNYTHVSGNYFNVDAYVLGLDGGPGTWTVKYGNVTITPVSGTWVRLRGSGHFSIEYFCDYGNLRTLRVTVYGSFYSPGGSGGPGNNEPGPDDTTVGEP